MSARSGRRPRHSAQVMYRRRRVTAGLLAVVVVAAVVWALTSRDGEADPPAGPVAERTTPAAPITTTTTTTTKAATAERTGSEPTRSEPTRSETHPEPAKSAPMDVAEHGPGTFAVVPGSTPAPGKGEVETVRVEIEKGTDVDPRAFADTVLATLNDRRSWAHGGERSFARTDGPADIQVMLASPDTSERLCRPLVTHGTLSCSIGERAILTTYRWAWATPGFDDLGVYRQYVVNHEVGHVLGRGHERCPGAGERAPVMQQQTIKVAPCEVNPWPYPRGTPEPEDP